MKRTRIVFPSFTTSAKIFGSPRVLCDHIVKCFTTLRLPQCFFYLHRKRIVTLRSQVSFPLNLSVQQSAVCTKLRHQRVFSRIQASCCSSCSPGTVFQIRTLSRARNHLSTVQMKQQRVLNRHVVCDRVRYRVQVFFLPLQVGAKPYLPRVVQLHPLVLCPFSENPLHCACVGLFNLSRSPFFFLRLTK